MLLSVLLGLAVTTLTATCALGAPRPQDQDIQELNEVWAPGPSPSPRKHFDGFSFKTLIKALARFNGGAKSQLELAEATTTSDNPLSQEYSETSVSPGEPPVLDVSEDLLSVPTPGPLEDDALNIKPIVKPDKSYRFTHNFRFGYGALPGLP